METNPNEGINKQKIVFCKPKILNNSPPKSQYSELNSQSDYKYNPSLIEQPISEIKKNIKKKNLKYNEDIWEIHKLILDIFEKEYQELPIMKLRLKRLDWIIQNADNDYDKQQALEEYNKLLTNIELIESGFREARYIYNTEKILEEYNSLVSKPIKVDFMGNKIFDDDEKKQTLIGEFLNIAKNYVNIKPIEGKRKSMLCEECKIELQRDDDFFFICPNCGYSIKHFASISSYGEGSRINVAQRYVYDKRAHFGDSIKKFQAKQNTTILEQVYKDLWDKINSHDIPIDKLSEDHIYEFLKLTGHSDHYEDIKLIYCELTGKVAPDISHLEQKLFELFDEVDPVYERVKSPGRVNFLNGQFVLFKLLQKLKYPCKESDFYILRTREKMLEHDQIWKKICAELSWTYIPTA